MLPRCSVCLVRHTEATECLPRGEEGRVTREILTDAFREGWGVCLPCQCVLMFLTPEERERGCPDCGEPWERFAEDDLEMMECEP